MGSINGYSIILNLTQLFSISTKIKEYLDNIIVKDIKGILLFKPKLLKLKINNKKLFKDKKAYLNIIATFSIYALITKTKGIRLYIVDLVAYL